jgi:hypothetical protein
MPVAIWTEPNGITVRHGKNCTVLYLVCASIDSFQARQVVLRTDHAALTYLPRTPKSVGQRFRWLDLLAEYEPIIEHRAGTAHRNADALSGRPCVSREDGECAQCSRWSASTSVRRVHTRFHTARAPTVGTPNVGTPSAGVSSVTIEKLKELEEQQSAVDKFAGNADSSLDFLDVAATRQEQSEDRHIGPIL